MIKYTSLLFRWPLVFIFYLLSTYFQSTQAQKHPEFDNFTALFRPVKAPFNQSLFRKQLLTDNYNQIPLQYIIKFMGYHEVFIHNPFVTLGEIIQPSQNRWLLISRGTRAHFTVHLFIFNKYGRLLQKIKVADYPPIATYKYQLDMELKKDLALMLTMTNISRTGEESKEITKYAPDNKGTLTSNTLASDDITNQYIMKERVQMYYAYLTQGAREKNNRQNKSFDCIHHFFSPFTKQWLGLKNINHKVIDREAKRFLTTKEDVDYKLDWQKIQPGQNSLSIPVTLSWKGYKAKVMAKFIFNQFFEITHLTETSIR